MTIRVNCPACHQTLKAERRYAGRTVRCPACRAAVTIPTGEAESTGEILDPFAAVAESSQAEQREHRPPRRSRPAKKAPPRDAAIPRPASTPTVSEDDVGEWLSEGPPLQPPSAEEFVELPPQTPNWDGTTSTYDIAEMGAAEPPPRKKRRKT